MDDAKAVFEQAKTNGLQGDAFDQIEQSLVSKNPDAKPMVLSGKKPPKDQVQQLIDLYSKVQLSRSLIKVQI